MLVTACRELRYDATVPQTFAMNTPDPYKVRLVEALERAERWHTLQNIANQIGCGYQSLSKLKKLYVLGPENCQRLEKWLRDNDFWTEMDDQHVAREAVPGYTSSFTEAIARELEAKAAMLRSDLPDMDKKRLFGSWLKAYNEVWNQLNK